MTTIRVHRRQRFTTIDRDTINDRELSLKALGLLVWLLDKPDDWRVRSEGIAGSVKDGRDSVRAGLQELEQAGYIVREKIRLNDGTFHSVCHVHERPGQTGDGFPGAGEPDVGSPDVGEPGPIPKTETEDCERRETSSLAVEVVEPPPAPVRAAAESVVRRSLYDALVEGCGWIPEEMTKDSKRVTALAANDLIDMGVADANEVVQRCMAYRVKFSGAACTPKAVVKHWPGLRGELVMAEQEHRSRMATPKKESAAARLERLRSERNAR